MLTLKTVRIVLILVGVILVVSLLVPFLKQPVTTGAALATPPSRGSSSSGDGGGGGSGSGGESGGSDESGGGDTIMAAIYGQVVDLSTGRPASGLEIDINGSIVRTDSEGRYSLTGLHGGTYNAVLLLPGQATAAESAATIQLADQETTTIDLNYYSETPPTPTNTPEPEPTSTPPPVEAADEVAAGLPAVDDDAAAAFSPLTAPTDGNTAVWINPGHINNEEGVVGNITIDVANVNDLGAFQAMLNYNPKIIEVEDVTLGNFLDSTGRQTNPLVTEIDNTIGQISFVAFTSGDTAGPNGGGTLAVVNFISKQAGVSELDLEDVVLVARLGRTLETTVGDGRVSVSICFADLNKDDIIDVVDVQAVAGRVGQTLGDPNYVMTYDLDNDNVISQADVQMITDRLYETCP